MRHQTGKSRRGANLAAARAVKAQRDADRIARTLHRKRIPASLANYIIRSYLQSCGGTVSLASLQRSAEEGTPGASLTLGAFERLAERRMRTQRGIRDAMRETNPGYRPARLQWPVSQDRTPDHWQRRIAAPEGGIARLAWREVLVRHGAKVAAEWCEERGIGWQYPASETDRPGPAIAPDVATAAADRAALADGTA